MRRSRQEVKPSFSSQQVRLQINFIHIAVFLVIHSLVQVCSRLHLVQVNSKFWIVETICGALGLYHEMKAVFAKWTRVDYASNMQLLNNYISLSHAIENTTAGRASLSHAHTLTRYHTN